MTNPSYTAICLLLDRSGSMESIRADAEGGLKKFIDDQRQIPGTCTLRVDQFDNQYENVYPSTSIDDAPYPQIVPRSMTRLLDAWGRSMSEFGEELAKLPESDRPGKVLYVVITDGQENDSREWTRPQVMEAVKRQQDQFNWEFIYLGANQDAVSEGRSFGVKGGQSMTYGATAQGVGSTYSSLSSAAAAFRGGGSAEFSDEQRKEADQ